MRESQKMLQNFADENAKGAKPFRVGHAVGITPAHLILFAILVLAACLRFTGLT